MTRMHRTPRPLQRFAPTVALAGGLLAGAVVLGGCGASVAGSEAGPETVQLGGTAAPATLDRPWGQVTAAPRMEKAEEPTPADLAFAAEMVPHHSQALQLSNHVLAHERIDERVAASAEFILVDQSDEISQMSGWLDAWSAGGHSGHSGHGDNDDHRVHAMPGMVPQARVDGLRELPAAAAEVEFLVLMIAHHRGAVDMAHDYLADAHNSYTSSTARHIIREQEIEIDYMDLLVEELCADDGVSTCP